MEIVANGECFSIVSDYLGTPMQAYDKQGDKVWEQELDIYGRQRKRPSAFIPFKYQGSTRIRRRDCITIVSATTTRMQGVTSVKIR